MSSRDTIFCICHPGAPLRAWGPEAKASCFSDLSVPSCSSIRPQPSPAWLTRAQASTESLQQEKI